MRVLGNRVLVKRVEDKALTSSIIEVVSLGRPEPGHYAIVVAVGQGLRTVGGGFIPIECKADDLVILKKYSGAPVSLGPANAKEEFHLVDAEDVLAVVEK